MGPDTCCVTPIEFKMSLNANPNASFSLSTWILKSPTIMTLSADITNSERKSANSLIKSVWCPGGLYRIASTKVKQELLLALDNFTLRTITSKELYFKLDL